VSDLVAELAKLAQVTPKLTFGDARTLGKLQRVQAGLGDDRGEDVEKAGKPAGAIHAARIISGWLADLFPGGGVVVALKRVGLSLLLVPHLLVEPAGDHLVGHRL